MMHLGKFLLVLMIIFSAVIANDIKESCPLSKDINLVCIKLDCNEYVCKITVTDAQSKKEVPLPDISRYPMLYNTVEISNQGRDIKLSNGSAWISMNAVATLKWSNKDKVIIEHPGFFDSSVLLFNETKKERVGAQLDSVKSKHDLTVQNLDDAKSIICFSDGNCWEYELIQDRTPISHYLKIGDKIIYARNIEFDLLLNPVKILLVQPFDITFSFGVKSIVTH